MAVKNCFIRGSVVRYVQLPADAVDTQLLEDATRRGGRLPTNNYAFPVLMMLCRSDESSETIRIRYIVTVGDCIYTNRRVIMTFGSFTRLT